MDNPDNFAPYASPENVLRVLARARKGGIKKVDEPFLSQIGIGEGMIPRTLRALEFLEMRGPDGEPTERLNRYIVASDDDAMAVLSSAVRDSYSLIFRAVDPSTDDRVKVMNAFRPMTPNGQWTRMVTLFLGLCKAAGMEVKEPPSDRPGKDGPPRERATRRLKRTPQLPRATLQEVVVKPPPLDPALAGVVAKLGGIATVEELDRWWTAFRPLFEFVKPQN